MTESWPVARGVLRCYVEHGPSSCFEDWEGTYVALRLGILLLLSWLAAGGCYGIAIVFTSMIALDILVFNTAAVFVTGGFGSTFRSMTLTMIAYVSLALALAPVWIWLRFQDDTSTWRRFGSGIYQSVRTLTTAGPDADHLGSGEKLFASFEMFAGIYFLSIIIAGYLSASGGSAK